MYNLDVLQRFTKNLSEVKFKFGFYREPAISSLTKELQLYYINANEIPG